MKKSVLRTAALAVVAAFGVTACGDGGGNVGSDGGGGLAGGGVTGTGISYGTVTGFGSVFVNGVKYNTDAATILLDDNPGVEGDLRVGMVVKVEGSVNDDSLTGTATKIEFDDVLEGTVSAPPNLLTNTLVAMGQTIRFDNVTVYEDRVSGATGTLVAFRDEVAVNNVIEVSGWIDDSGAIRAARVERKADSLGVGSELELKGMVANLDVTAKTFTIGGLTIDYSSVVSLPAALANGQMVEVKSTQALSGNTLVASQVKAEDSPITGVTSGRLEVEGYITAVSGTEFTVLSKRVKTTSSTVYENGTASNIGIGKKVEVKGTAGNDGTLTATKVSFRLDNNVEIEGTVSAVDNAANSVTVMGIKVQLNSLTQMEDASDAKQRPFALSHVNVGDFVEVRGYIKDGQVIATRLERDDVNSRVLLQGTATAKAADLSTLTILGVTVATSSSAQYRLVSDGAPVSRADFFSAISANATVVKAKGSWNGSNLVATELEIEN